MNPQFISCSSGNLFCLDVMSDGDPKGAITFLIPPFAEEMNKSRRMFALLQQQLLQSGQSSVIFDLQGTGDSQGDFADSTWHMWRQNLQDIVVHFADNEKIDTINFVSLRIGGLLLNDSLAQFQANILSKIRQIHYWNPVFNASQFINQFLRLKLAADMMNDSANKQSAKELRQQLDNLGSLEVAGYQLNANLVKQMEAANLVVPETCNEVDLFAYEVSSMEEITPALARMLPKISEFTKPVTACSIDGAQFWSTQEIAVCESLIAQTIQNMQGEPN